MVCLYIITDLNFQYLSNKFTCRGVHRFGSVETEPNLANQSYNSVLKVEPNLTELALQPNRSFISVCSVQTEIY